MPIVKFFDDSLLKERPFWARLTYGFFVEGIDHRFLRREKGNNHELP